MLKMLKKLMAYCLACMMVLSLCTPVSAASADTQYKPLTEAEYKEKLKELYDKDRIEYKITTPMMMFATRGTRSPQKQKQVVQIKNPRLKRALLDAFRKEPSKYGHAKNDDETLEIDYVEINGGYPYRKPASETEIYTTDLEALDDIEVDRDAHDNKKTVIITSQEEFDELCRIFKGYKNIINFSYDGSYFASTAYDDVQKTLNIDALADLSSLRVLYLYYMRSYSKYNNTTGGVTDYSVLSKLSSLETLSLTHSNAESSIDVIKNLTNLSTLRISFNGLKDISHLKNLKNLECLDIMNNEIEDMSVIKNFPKLKDLNINSNRIKDFSVLPEKFKACKYAYDYRSDVTLVCTFQWAHDTEHIHNTKGTQFQIQRVIDQDGNAIDWSKSKCVTWENGNTDEKDASGYIRHISDDTYELTRTFDTQESSSKDAWQIMLHFYPKDSKNKYPVWNVKLLFEKDPILPNVLAKSEYEKVKKPAGYVKVEYDSAPYGSLDENIFYVKKNVDVTIPVKNPTIKANYSYAEFTGWSSNQKQFSADTTIKANYKIASDKIPVDDLSKLARPDGYVTVHFDVTNKGTAFAKDSNLHAYYYVKKNAQVTFDEFTTKVVPTDASKWKFTGWSPAAQSTFTKDTTFTAQFETIENLIPDGKAHPDSFIKVTLDPTSQANDTTKRIYWARPNMPVTIPSFEPVSKDTNKPFTRWSQPLENQSFTKETTIHAQYANHVKVETGIASNDMLIMIAATVTLIAVASYVMKRKMQHE